MKRLQSLSMAGMMVLVGCGGGSDKGLRDAAETFGGIYELTAHTENQTACKDSP